MPPTKKISESRREAFRDAFAEGSALTRADSFAMCAPEEIPEWFKSEPPDPRPEPPSDVLTRSEREAVNYVNNSDAVEDDEFEALVNDQTFMNILSNTDDEQRVIRHLKAHRAFNVAFLKWQRDRDIHHYFAWRRFFAEKMLEVMDG
jgi:hypothetical protein